MVELVDTQDLKSCDHLVVRVQVPPGTEKLLKNGFLFVFLNMKSLIKQPLQIALSVLVIFPIMDLIGEYKTYDFQDSLIKGARFSAVLFVVLLIVKKIESNKKSKQ